MNPADNPPLRGEMVSVEQVAERLNVSKHSVLALLRKGVIPWFPLLAGKWMIDSADVDDWLSSIKVHAGESLAARMKTLDPKVDFEESLCAAMRELANKGRLDFLFDKNRAR